MTLRPLYVNEPIGNQLPALDGNRLRDAVNDPYEPYGFVNLAIPASGSVDVPGPAAGLIRLFDSMQLISDTLGSAMTVVTHSIVGATTVPAGRNATVTGSVIATIHALGYGEVLRVTNAGTPTGRVVGTYVDVDASTYTLVRLTLTAVSQTVIPVPPAGYFSRWAHRVPLMQTATKASFQRLAVYNPDVVTHSVQFTLGGTLCSRTATMATLGSTNPQLPAQIPVTPASGVMAALTTEAINTTNVSLIGVYETLPIPTSR